MDGWTIIWYREELSDDVYEWLERRTKERLEEERKEN